MNAQIRKALRSLPWYIVFGYLFGPLILAPFTLGASLWIYVAPFAAFIPKGQYVSDSAHQTQVIAGLLAPLAPGVFFWVLRQFWRFAFFSWKERNLRAHA